MNKLKIVTGALLLSSATFIQNSLGQSKADRLDSLFSVLTTSGGLNGNFIVAEEGKIILEKTIGYSDFSTKTKNNQDTKFQIGSVSKVFTAVSVLQLQENGFINVNDFFVKYFPEFPYKDVTIHQLLTHSSGIPEKEELFLTEINSNPLRQFTNKDIIPALIKHKKAIKPGSAWHYNNMGYALLSMLVEKVSGESFSKYLHKHIFTPSNMSSSYLLGHQGNIKGLATGYSIKSHYIGDRVSVDKNFRVRPWTYNMRGFVGCTNIVSTAKDLLKFDIALRNNKLLKASTTNQMYTPSKLRDGSNLESGGEFGPAEYGIGWFLPKLFTKGQIVMHNGMEPGFFSIFVRDLTNNRTIIFLDNAESRSFGRSFQETFNLLTESKHFAVQKDKKSLFLEYIQNLYKKGPTESATIFNINKSDTTNFCAEERELNDFGLELLDDKHYQNALEALKLCTLLFPESSNAYDSYGKALLQSGSKKLAELMYKKSLAMNPGNEEAKSILKSIASDDTPKN